MRLLGSLHWPEAWVRYFPFSSLLGGAVLGLAGLAGGSVRVRARCPLWGKISEPARVMATSTIVGWFVLRSDSEPLLVTFALYTQLEVSPD